MRLGFSSILLRSAAILAIAATVTLPLAAPSSAEAHGWRGPGGWAHSWRGPGWAGSRFRFRASERFFVREDRFFDRADRFADRFHRNDRFLDRADRFFDRGERLFAHRARFGFWGPR